MLHLDNAKTDVTAEQFANFDHSLWWTERSSSHRGHLTPSLGEFLCKPCEGGPQTEEGGEQMWVISPHEDLSAITRGDWHLCHAFREEILNVDDACTVTTNTL